MFQIARDPNELDLAGKPIVRELPHLTGHEACDIVVDAAFGLHTETMHTRKGNIM